MKSLVLALCLFMFPAITSHAANSYKINAGVTVSINEHGTCKRVKNNKSVALFVPTKTSAEWTAFRGSSASGATQSNCVMTCTMTGSKMCDSPRSSGNIIRSSYQSSVSACKTYCQATTGVDVCEFSEDSMGGGTCYAWGPCTLGSTTSSFTAGKCVLE